jgi:hypothetical protein
MSEVSTLQRVDTYKCHTLISVDCPEEIPLANTQDEEDVTIFVVPTLRYWS